MSIQQIKGLVARGRATGAFSRLGGMLLAAILAPLVVSQLGITMTSAVTSACLALAVGCLLVCLGGGSPGASLPMLCALVVLCSSTHALSGYGFAGLLAASLAVGVILCVLSLGPVRRCLLGGIPAPLKAGMAAVLGLLSAGCALRLCGVIAVDSGGAIGLVGIFDPAFVDAAISLLATVILQCSGVPAAGLLGLLVATFAGIPLGLAQAPAGVLAAPDVSLIAGFSTDLVAGIGRLSTGLASPQGLGLVFGLALCLLASSDQSSEGDSGKRLGTGSFFASLGLVASSFLGMPVLGLEASPGHGSRTGLLKEGVLLAACVLCLGLLSPLVACVPISAACGPLLVCSLRPVARLSCVNLQDLGEAVPVFGMVACGLVSGSLGWAVAVGFLLHAGVCLGTGRSRSLSAASVVLTAVSLLFVLTATGL